MAPSASDARSIVSASLSHLTRLVQRKGKFIYAHEAGDIDAVHDGYNLLRHCGTLWFMTRAAQLPGAASIPDLVPAMGRAASYIGGKLQPAPWSPAEDPTLALVSKGMVKLGGLGLALLALGEAQKIPALQPALAKALPLGPTATISRLRRYALDEIDGDDFRHKRDILTGDIHPFRSDYYTGEAIFGLLTTGPSTDALTHVITALMRRGYGWAEQSHWMAYAACEAIERDVIPEVLGAAYLTGLMQATLTNVAYRARRQSTPIGCRAEALTRVLLLARARPWLLQDTLVDKLRIHVAEDLTLLLDWYQDGQFWQGDTSRKVQIDYIQHNATAFMQWADLGAGG